MFFDFRNGKNVTTEENALFMSIFKTVSEEDDSIEDHFYIAESDDSPNVNLRIWRQVLRSYISLVWVFFINYIFQIVHGINHINISNTVLTFKVPITTKAVCSIVLEVFRTNSVDPDQTAPEGAV